MWTFSGYEVTLFHLVAPDEIPEGLGIHYGTIIFTLCSFLICSYVLEKNKILKLRNVIYSFVLGGFINGLFEVIYVILYDVIHHGYLWINLPFLYNDLGVLRLYPTYRNWYWVIIGVLFLWIIKARYKHISFVKRVPFKKYLSWRNPFKNNKLMMILTVYLMFWCLWIFYPFEYMKVRNNLFPQYIYGFREFETIPDNIPDENIVQLLEQNWKAVYIPNTLVRISFHIFYMDIYP
jgi:hypothetical protein